MLLTKIHQVKGIGLLHDTDASRHKLKKANFLYADNGRGKSTLASIFQSCSTNDPSLIMKRRTVDGQNEPEIKLQFSNGQWSSFQNGSWDNSRPEFMVFDADFVEKNVYAGGQVTADQRRNLLHFALGTDAVTAQREYDQADVALKLATETVRDITRELSGIHGELSLIQFKELVGTSINSRSLLIPK